MPEPIRLTVVYEPTEDGWIVASIPEVPGAFSQGRTRQEAHDNVIDALRELLLFRFGSHPQIGTDQESESLELRIVA